MKKTEKENIIRIQTNKLKWYKSRGFAKNNLASRRIFPKSFLDKYYDSV